MSVNKSDLTGFIHKSVGKANDFTMTGSKFPMETELVYSSDSDNEGQGQDVKLPKNKDLSADGQPKDAAHKTNKSEDMS